MVDPKNEEGGVGRQWSLETHSTDHRGLQATLMDLSPNGAFAILAGRKGLALLDIEAPDTVVTRTSVQPRISGKADLTCLDPGCLQWSKDGAAVAVAWNDRIDVYSVESLDNPLATFSGSNALGKSWTRRTSFYNELLFFLKE